MIRTGSSGAEMVKNNMRTAERRNEFIAAAEELFNERGYENTTVDDIVTKMNVAKGLFYYYFDSKDKLLEIILNRLIDEIGSSITAVMESNDSSAMERYRELIAVNVENWVSSKIIGRLLQEREEPGSALLVRKKGDGPDGPCCRTHNRPRGRRRIFETRYPRDTAIAIHSLTRELLYQLPSCQGCGRCDTYDPGHAISDRKAPRCKARYVHGVHGQCALGSSSVRRSIDPTNDRILSN